MYFSKLELKGPERAVLLCVGLELLDVPRLIGTCDLDDFQLTKMEENYYNEMYTTTAA